MALKEDATCPNAERRCCKFGPRNSRRPFFSSQSEAELAALRRSVSRGRPYGSEVWVQDIVQRLGLQATIRPRGRPRKRPPAGPDGDDN
jgi:hypothetical protein